jgi:hypothetical protein
MGKRRRFQAGKKWVVQVSLIERYIYRLIDKVAILLSCLRSPKSKPPMPPYVTAWEGWGG